MSVRPDDLTGWTATEDSLVLASVSSPVEARLLDQWVTAQRRDNRDAAVELFAVPAGTPSPATVADLVERLEADEHRLVVPVRVFWIPEEGTVNLSQPNWAM